jgi:putative zinc finger/helix-turn-helix YgiT family protein
MRVRRENHAYEMSGLRSVVLVGVPVARCGQCGEVEVGIPGIEALHRAIAGALIAKPARLAPEEVRFLRKHLGLSSADFAAHMGTTPEAVSRWERGRAQMGPVADRLLRTLVALEKPVKDYSIDRLRAVGKDPAEPVRLSFRATGGAGWKPAAA